MEIQSFEDACGKLKLDPATILPDVSCFPEKHRKALTAMAKMYLIAEALNDGWQPDWNNDDEYKYYPWFDLEYDKDDNPSGFRFLVTFYGYTYTYSAGGSRLCFRTKQLSDYCASTFIELWRDMIVIPK
jgi:hypothetical protein